MWQQPTRRGLMRRSWRAPTTRAANDVAWQARESGPMSGAAEPPLVRHRAPGEQQGIRAMVTGSAVEPRWRRRAWLSREWMEAPLATPPTMKRGLGRAGRLTGPAIEGPAIERPVKVGPVKVGPAKYGPATEALAGWTESSPRGRRWAKALPRWRLDAVLPTGCRLRYSGVPTCAVFFR